MIRINLLPHREEKRRARRQQFYALSGLISVLAGLIVFLGWTIINGYISGQEEKNKFLKAETELLDKQIAQIKTLKDEINRLLAKKQVIESLQRDRGSAVGIFNEMAKQLPEGVYLKTLKQEGLRITITGVSQSNSRVSELMRNLEQSPTFESPKLIETKATTIDRRKMQDFNLTVQMTPVKSDEPKSEVAAAPTGGGGKK
jgi:type IV pilus assembly protein PilN